MKPYKIYGNNIDSNALNQFFEVMKMPWVLKGAVMPDGHLGYTLPIGGVVATDNMIVPSFCGYDLGCGVYAFPTTYKVDDIVKKQDNIFNQIYRDLPMGKGHQKIPIKHCELELNKLLPSTTSWFKDLYKEFSGHTHAGSLGSGNHHCEVSVDENEQVWITVHSGSRGIGWQSASHYMKIASNSNKAKEGCYPLSLNSVEGQDYSKDLDFCLKFALINREAIAVIVNDAISRYCVNGLAIWNKHINRNHNHAEKRVIALDGVNKNVIIHRKGATHAEFGMMGIIPGDMKEGSYIVKGKGNPESLFSSSHGAGRLGSRRDAKARLNVDDFKKNMKGIKAKIGDSTLNEAPGAYKNLDVVMAAQTDLIEIVHKLTPLINIKA